MEQHTMTEEKLPLETRMHQLSQEISKIISEEEIEKIARKVGFVKRQGKIKAWQFLYLCAFSELDIAKNTLVTLRANLSVKTESTISSQALDQRLNNEAVEFLKEIFIRLLKNSNLNDSAIPSIFNEYFKRIRIVDSTAFQVPEIYKNEYSGSSGRSQPSEVKIQLEYELKTGNFMHVDIGPGKGNDNIFGSKIKDTFRPEDLSLRDLGYFSFKDFEDLESKKGVYVSRLKPNIAVYLKNEDVQYLKNGHPRKSTIYKRVNLANIASQMAEGGSVGNIRCFCLLGELRKGKKGLSSTSLLRSSFSIISGGLSTIISYRLDNLLRVLDNSCIST
jgi:hypothetical protein